uniref:Uncharacterized protein n=1 Tax=Arundo donax TaxID=35708 RepID=A0A0A8YG55_ARUDO
MSQLMVAGSSPAPLKSQCLPRRHQLRSMGTQQCQMSLRNRGALNVAKATME